MIHKGKVAAMTKLAIEEKTDVRQSFIIRHYWFNDYFTTEIWKDFFLIAVAFAFVVLLGLVAYGDSWTYTYHVADVIALAKKLLGIFLAVEAVGILLGLYFHVKMYREAFRKHTRMQATLRQLGRLYQAQEQMEKVREK